MRIETAFSGGLELVTGCKQWSVDLLAVLQMPISHLISLIGQHLVEPSGRDVGLFCEPLKDRCEEKIIYQDVRKTENGASQRTGNIKEGQKEEDQNDISQYTDIEGKPDQRGHHSDPLPSLQIPSPPPSLSSSSSIFSPSSLRHLRGSTVRPGLLVLVNDIDWEVLHTHLTLLQSGDKVTFISTLHGG